MHGMEWGFSGVPRVRVRGQLKCEAAARSGVFIISFSIHFGLNLMSRKPHTRLAVGCSGRLPIFHTTYHRVWKPPFSLAYSSLAHILLPLLTRDTLDVGRRPLPRCRMSHTPPRRPPNPPMSRSRRQSQNLTRGRRTRERQPQRTMKVRRTSCATRARRAAARLSTRRAGVEVEVIEAPYPALSSRRRRICGR